MPDIAMLAMVGVLTSPYRVPAPKSIFATQRQTGRRTDGRTGRQTGRQAARQPGRQPGREQYTLGGVASVPLDTSGEEVE